jgi:hypothetical protein
MRHKWSKSRLDRAYKALLMKICPGLHEGYFDEYLYLVLKKR